jgi:hypothetical protein
MTKTVDQAFEEFMSDSIDLDPDVVKEARKSRDNLLENIKDFDDTDDFFDLCDDYDVHFGSFARKTQCRPLDDIDLMIGISANGATYYSNDPWDNVRMTPSKSNEAQMACSTALGYLDSKKVVNRFRRELEKVREYNRSEVKPAGEAVVLNLKSKEWAFDIVPCFHTVVEDDGRDYFLIPNSKGNWQKTDPTIDRDYVSKINQLNNGRVLKLIRIVKKWNEVYNTTPIPSYMLETMVINFCEQSDSLTNYIDINFYSFLSYIESNIDNPVWDMKNIQGDINSLSPSMRKFRRRSANESYVIALEAREFENKNDHDNAIRKWKELFGEEFPDYE